MEQILVVSVILVDIIQMKANHLVVLVMKESFKLMRVQVHVISAIQGNIKIIKDIRTVLIVLQDTTVLDIKTLLQQIVALVPIVQEEMLEQYVKPVNTQLQQTPSIQVLVVIVDPATIVQEVVLVINVHRVSTRQ